MQYQPIQQKGLLKIPTWCQQCRLALLLSMIMWKMERSLYASDIVFIEIYFNPMNFKYDAMRYKYDPVNFKYDSMRYKYDPVNFKYDAMRYKYDPVNFKYDAMRYKYDAMRYKYDSLKYISIQ